PPKKAPKFEFRISPPAASLNRRKLLRHRINSAKTQHFKAEFAARTTGGICMATSAAPRAFKNFINGEWVEPRSGKVIENRNPANTTELIGMFPASNADDVNAAVESAKNPYAGGPPPPPPH